VKGTELSLTLVPIEKRNFSWTFRTTYQANVENIDYLPIPAFNSGVGFGVAWGHSKIEAGVHSSIIWGDVPYSCVNTTVAGKVVVGTGSDGLPCHALAIGEAATFPNAVVRDTMIADANPRGSTQFTNSFQWGRWSGLVMLDWRNGGYMSDMTNTAFDQGGNSRDYDVVASTIVDSAGRLMSRNVALGALRYSAWSAGDARPYLQDGTYLKLREITITYDAPKRWADLASARSMRISLSGRNLMMLSKYWGEDPEFNNGGSSGVGRFVDLAPYPASRQFFFSINLGY
jgi:hypothetical protein